MNKKELEEAIIDTLGEKLLEEFTEIGESYPNFAAMFIDIVGIVSQQNSQINSISKALQGVVLEINKMRDSLEELEKGTGFSRDTEEYLTDSIDHVTFIHNQPPVKKEDLN